MLKNNKGKEIVKIMKSRILFYCILFFFSCNIFQNQKNNQELADSSKLDVLRNNQKLPLVKMRKTPCFGKCPYFEVVIFNDGSIKYEGFKFVDKIGLYSSEINKKKVAHIEDYIRRLDFFSFDEVYDAKVTDLPSIIIEVNLNGKHHKVKGRYRMPEKFKLFTKLIDDILLGVDSWSKVIN